MFYREAGQFKTTYAADAALFPILQDKLGIALILAAAFILVPLVASDFVIDSVLTPILVFSLAAIGLNLLTGYTGLLSLGTAGFMGVGAFACYKLATLFPGINILVMIVCSGFFAAAAGIVFGLPSLRIKGFYLAVATLASQFFLSWCFIRIPWLYNYNVSASIEVPTRARYGLPRLRHRHLDVGQRAVADLHAGRVDRRAGRAVLRRDDDLRGGRPDGARAAGAVPAALGVLVLGAGGAPAGGQGQGPDDQGRTGSHRAPRCFVRLCHGLPRLRVR